MPPRFLRVSSKLFEKVYTKGRRHSFGGFFVVTLPLPQKEVRYACAVAGRSKYKAHERNRLRRQMYAIVRKKVSQLPTGAAYVFIGAPKQKNISFTDITKTIDTLITNACLH